MQMLDNFIIILLIVLSFISGLKLSDHYHNQEKQNLRDALERQFLRLKAGSDADDPVRPYRRRLAPLSDLNVGDCDGDPQPIPESFVRDLKQNGKAKMTFKKSDVSS